MHEVVRWCTPLLPEHKPRYLMGVGTLPEMAQAVAHGVDLFDCVLPTRLGRHGAALVNGERWNLKMPASGRITPPGSQLPLRLLPTAQPGVPASPDQER